MKHLLYSLLALVTAAAWLLSCDEDCPTCPDDKPPEDNAYQLLFSYVSDGIENRVMVYNTKTGAAVDSLLYAGDPFDNMVFSHDGNFACYTSNYNLRIGGSETLVTAWPSHDTVAHLRGTGALAAYLTPDDRYLLLTGGNLVAILTFPELGIVFRDSASRRWGDGSSGSASSWGGALHPGRRLAYVAIEPFFDSIFVIDYSESPVQISSYQLRDQAGVARSTVGPAVCTEDYLIFVVPGRDQPGFLGVYDALDLHVVHDRRDLPAVRVFGGVLHPNGRQMFVANNGGMERPWIGGIDVYDIESDVLRPFIAQGEIDMGAGAFVPSDIQFSPDGKKMYVMMGADGFWLGPILEIQIKSKEVTRRWNFINGFSRQIRLNSKRLEN